jgi:tetratricopeptide (TPR) repeat protein
MAEQIYQLLLSTTQFKDLAAWRGLLETLTPLKRTKEFVQLCGRALALSALRDDARSAAAVRYMRGLCLEMDGKIGEALADYEDAIRLDGTNWGALNNAAWQIAKSAASRIADGRAYVDRALKLRPAEAAVLDTAAEVYSVQGDLHGALDLIDRALAAAPEAKARAYTVHKAEILYRADRDADATALLEALRREGTDDPAAQRARALLWEIERKHLPEEEPAQLPAVPEDEEESPLTGGGE